MALCIKAGTAVYSKAGHDRGRAYIVIRSEGERVWLSDGKTRTLKRPKVKNIKHVQPVKTVVISEEELPYITDLSIRSKIGALQKGSMRNRNNV